MTARERALSRLLRRHRAGVTRIVGGLVAAAAVALCGRALADSWPSVHRVLRHADLGWLPLVIGFSAAAMLGLGLQWWRWLRAIGVPAPPVEALAWYLGGELGKYLPGGIWPILGRGELARRGGVDRGLTYTGTLLSYGTMCGGAAAVCGVGGPVAAIAGAPAWGWLFLPLVVLVPVAVQPAVLSRALRLGNRVSGGRLVVPTPSWPTSLLLVGWSVPSWLLLGAASVAVTEMLRLQAPAAQVVVAAVAAWVVGFLAVPVPAGAGVRELVFVGLCGLPAATGVTVALLSRAALILVDAALGLAGLARAAGRPSSGGPAAVPAPAGPGTGKAG